MKLRVISYLAALPRSKTPESIAKNADKTNTLRFFIEGVNQAGDQGEVCDDSRWQPADVAVILGWVHEHSKDSAHLRLRREIVENQKRNGGRTVVADSNLVLYKNTNNPGYWLRYSYDHVFPGLGEYCDQKPDPERWAAVQQTGVQLRPWRTDGNHILLCLQRDGGWSMGGFDVLDWAMNTITEIRRYSGRPIVIRSHPGDKRAPKYCHRLEKLLTGRRIPAVTFTDSSRSLMQDFKHCWAVVNHNSSPGVAAAIEGIPVFVTDPQRSQARDVANHDLNIIEHPGTFDRLAWAQRLSQFHWSHADLRSGRCWQHMRQWARP
jgi:hypothetical protein